MRPALILALAPLLMGQGALPRPRCDFGAAMERLRAAEELARTQVTGLQQGRELGEALRAAAADLSPRLADCGCRDLAALAAEAATAAAPAGSAADAAAAARDVAHAGFRLGLVRERFAAQGCR